MKTGAHSTVPFAAGKHGAVALRNSGGAALVSPLPRLNFHATRRGGTWARCRKCCSMTQVPSCVHTS